MVVIQAYQFALDPTPAQEEALRSHCGAQRFAYNWGLGRVMANLAQREAERSYSIAEVDLTPALDWSAYGLRKHWNRIKAEVAPWWSANSKEAYACGLANLATALRNWHTSKTGQRPGPKIRFPRFKGRRAGLSYRFTTGSLGLADADRRHMQRQQARRQGPHQHTRPSRRWVKTQARISRAHTRVANARRDGLHQLTARLAGRYGTIVVEDLQVAGMLRNRRLARRIAGAGWAELGRQLAYKTTWRGGRLIVANRWYPSSKTCSRCGAVRTKLALSERRFCCGRCGLMLDRDLNAARNLATLATQVAGTSSPSCGATRNEPAGNPRKTSSAGNGYRHGKTHAVNAPPQGGTAD